MLSAAVHESGSGTNRTNRASLTMSALRVRLEVAGERQTGPFWTHLGLGAGIRFMGLVTV